MIKYNNRAKLKKICKESPFINAQHGDNDDVPTYITRHDIDEILTMLFKDNAEPCTPSELYGAGPIRDYIFLLIHSDMKKEFTQERMPGFIDVSLYPLPEKALKFEIGAVGNLRVLVSDKMPIFKNESAKEYNVYPCILFDKNDKSLVLKVTR